MNFLAPLFLLGALAVAAPILFHLIRRTSRERMTFSSLMFLSPVLPRVTRRSRLENIFLLILRCLVLGLLALGFARPYFKRPAPARPAAATGQRTVVLIDASASMKREGLWTAALAKADEVLQGIPSSEQAAILIFDRQARTLLGFDQWSAMNPGERAALASQRLREIKPSWSATHLGTALTSAAEVFEESKQADLAAGPKRIILISDLQEGSRLEGLQGYEWPRGIEVTLEPVKARRPTNAGLQLVTEREESSQALADAGPRVRIGNSTDAKREQFQVRWEGLSGTPPLETYVPPGQSRIFPAPKPASGPWGERLVLTGDEEDFDNSAYFIEPKAERIRVLYLGNETETDSTQPLFYLKRAFQQTRRQTVEIVARRADAPLAPSDLLDLNLVIVAETLTEETAKEIRQFQQKGGVTLFVLKSPAAATTLARLAGISGLTVEDVSGGRYAMLGEIDFQHPLFLPFADARFSDFTKIHFWRHRRIDPSSLGRARVLARFDDDQAPALLEFPAEKGALLALTSGWHPADSQLALSSKFVPLLYSILEQGGGLKVGKSQYLVGDSVPLTTTNLTRLTIRKPDGTAVDLAAGEKFSQTDQPGIYTVTSTEPALRFAVNLDPAESRTAPMAVEELERFGVPMKKSLVKTPIRQTEKARQHLLATELESQQRLWRWLLIAALSILLVETWLAGWLTRRTTTATEPT